MRFLKKSVQLLSDYWLKGSITFGSLFFSFAALADDPTIGSDNLGTAATKLGTEVSIVKTTLLTSAQAIGIGMALGGMILWRRVSQEKSQKSHGQAATVMIIGAFCYFLPYLMGASASSLLSP